MNENARLWMRALETGEFEGRKFKQGTKTLRKFVEDKSLHCCLGVACEIYNKMNPKSRLKIGRSNGTFDYDGETGGLPSKVVKWLGIKTKNGELQPAVKNFRSNLVDMNDGGMPFKEIAKVLRKHRDNIFIK